MGKAYRTVSHEALCVVTGMMPIDIKIEEVARPYQLTKGMANNNTLFDKDMEVRYWKHPAEANINSTDEKEETGSLHKYTDGSKTESGQHIKSVQRRLNIKCTNNQSEQLAILAALQYIEKTHRTDKKVTIYTGSKITLVKYKTPKYTHT